MVNLQQIGASVEQVFFVVNIYTPHRTFGQVAEPFCRVIDDSTGAELCRYGLREAGSDNGLIIAKIAREAGGRWGFHALGLPCRGRTYKDSLPQIRNVSTVKTSALMVRSHTNDSLGTILSASQPPLAYAPPRFEPRVDSANTQCCTTM